MVGSMKMQGTLNALLFSAATIGIFVHEHTLGWILLILGVLHLKLCGLEYLRTQILTYSSIAILGLVGMGTDLDLQSPDRVLALNDLGFALPRLRKDCGLGQG